MHDLVAREAARLHQLAGIAQEDLARLAKTLQDDRKDDPASKQTLWVNPSRRPPVDR